MKFSERWLREWVDPAIETEELLQRLTMAGLEVEGTEVAANDFSGVIVGEVLAVASHPDADKLHVCEVSDGKDIFQVVCGAANVRAGLKIPFARIGAQLSADFKIKKAKLRGVESHGMLCSAAELGLVEVADGLLELPANAPTGIDIRQYLQLDDVIVEVNLTPNRGDCLSVAGLAREVSVITKTALNVPVMSAVKASIPDTFPVELQSTADCPRYLGRIIRNINPDSETPLWMLEKLRRSGIRNIDPVVDVTNYVLLELGQPMHAFDFDKLEGGIRVRRAEPAEALILLDGKEVALTPETLVIADHKKVLAMAGIMGGKYSAVSPRTTNIFLESAFFVPLAIAGRARSYGMHTDAAHRYERGVDPNLSPLAMERATALLLDIVGGQAGPIEEVNAQMPATAAVSLRNKRIEKLLGVSLPADEIHDILTRLGLQPTNSHADGFCWKVPSWRFDISIEVDLIEELARVYGYNNLSVSTAQTNMSLQPQPEANVGIKSIRNTLVGLGYQEVVTYSFVAPELAAVLGDGTGNEIKLANPISQDMSVMRSSLWPGLLTTLKYNQNRQQTRARLFESGLVFNNINNKIEQVVKVGCLIWGAHHPEQWGSVEKEVDFYDIKGDVELLLGLTHNLAHFSFDPGLLPALQPGQTAEIKCLEHTVGWLGALHPKILQALDIQGKVFLLELDYELMSAARITTVKNLSRYPSVRRDLAILLSESVSAKELDSLLRDTAGSELQDLIIFDLYSGKNIEKGKKSVALGLTFQHPSRTLSEVDINPIIDSCIKALADKFNAELRK
jgi:phenylalanyl-tRNA synthetase beta chain